MTADCRPVLLRERPLGHQDHRIVDAALERILKSESFRSSPKVRDFLRYVVTEELEGRGYQIKAYTIGIDALDRPDSFDPQKDPVVRVLAGRVRARLEEYYKLEGREDPVRIVLEKGTYRPSFQGAEQQSEIQVEQSQAPPVPVSESAASSGRGLLSWRSAALFLGFVLAGLMFFLVDHYFRHHTDEDNRAMIAKPAQLPVVEVRPFNLLLASHEADLVEGIRQQLIVDMAHFKSIRVRGGVADEAPSRTGKPPLPQADYLVNASLLKGRNESGFIITLTRSHTAEVLWGRTIRLPTNDAEFHATMFGTVRAIVTQLASSTGAIQRDALKRLSARYDSLANENTSSYECLLHFYAFDQAKEKKLEDIARSCLTLLTSENSRDSNVWASFAFVLFLDWTRSAGRDSMRDRKLFEKALRAASLAVRLDPSNATAHEYLGSIQMAGGNLESAGWSYRRALELNPSKPDIYVSLGWQEILSGNWEGGMHRVSEGIDLSPSPAGWMFIPVSIDAFRKGKYQDALDQADMIVRAGDERGIVLALAAAAALGDRDRVVRYEKAFADAVHSDPLDPLKEIRNIFNDPEVLADYERVLNRIGMGT